MSADETDSTNNEHFCFGRRFPEESSDSRIGIFDRYANFLSWHCFFSGVVWASTGGAYGFKRSKEIVRLFKRELTVYQRVLQDERTPRSAKLLRVLATGYFHLGYPESSVQPIVDEAFGLTNDKSPYVYLSHSGHFENLGLYEMVLRRCHFMVISDAGGDPECSFADLVDRCEKFGRF